LEPIGIDLALICHWLDYNELASATDGSPARFHLEIFYERIGCANHFTTTQPRRTLMSAGSPDHPNHQAPSIPTANLTGAQGVAQVIAAQPNAVVYGMPGGYTVQIYDALHFLRDRVQTRLVREEAFATVMAEAQARLTGSPAFVIGQGAWVLGNAGIGIMEAHLGSSPMVVLVDATEGGAFSHLGPYQAGAGGYGAYDLAAALKAITKQTFVALDPTQAIQMTQLAIKHASTGEPGPVAVVFHGKSLFERVNPSTQPPMGAVEKRLLFESPAPSPHAIAAAVDQLTSAQSPVVVAGNGVRLSKAQASLLAFAEKLGIPVVTTPAGKGAFPEDHPLACGLMGAFGHEVANHVVGQSDLIIAVGTKLGASDTANLHPKLIRPAAQKLIQIDTEALNIGWTLPVEVGIVADAKAGLAALLEACQGMSFSGLDRVSQARQTHGYFDRPFSSSAGHFSGRDAVAMLAQHLPDGSIATCDAGENRLFMLRDFQCKGRTSVLQPNGGGGMGYAVPAAISAALNTDTPQAVAVCGDGGISMTLHALMTAIENQANVLIVVLDNSVLGWVYNGQRGRVIASELQQFDYAAIARAMGCHAITTDDPEVFERELKISIGRPGVTVLVAKTTRQDRYQDVMSSLHATDIYAVPEQP
jgi:acetolactate synthase I/II/III large subunit